MMPPAFAPFAQGAPLCVMTRLAAESLFRAGLRVVAGVRNRPGPSHLSEGMRVLVPEDLAAGLLDRLAENHRPACKEPLSRNSGDDEINPLLLAQ